MSPRLAVESIFFDWGGTLAGTAREADNWIACARRAAAVLFADQDERLESSARLLTERNAEARLSADRDTAHREVDVAAMLSAWATEVTGQTPSDDRARQIAEAFWTGWLGVLDPISGAREALAECKARGYRLGLVSNVAAPAPFALAELDRLGLLTPLDACTFSSVTGYRKPHPSIYRIAIESLHPDAPPPPERMLFVGDGPGPDVIAPQRLGMKTVLVHDPDGHWPAEDRAEARPDLRIDHVSELLESLPDRRR